MSSRRSRGGLQRSTSNRTRPRLPPLASSSHSRRFGGWFRPLLCSPGSGRPRTWRGAAPPPAGRTSGGSALDPRPPGHPAPSSQAGGGFWRGVSREGKPVLKQHGSPQLLRCPFLTGGALGAGSGPVRHGTARLGTAAAGLWGTATGHLLSLRLSGSLLGVFKPHKCPSGEAEPGCPGRPSRPAGAPAPPQTGLGSFFLPQSVKCPPWGLW